VAILPVGAPIIRTKGKYPKMIRANPHEVAILRSVRFAGVPVAGLIAFAVSSSALSFAQVSPRLQLVDRSPVTIAGRGFKPTEQVRITVAAQGVVEKKTVRASSSGRFRVIFNDLRLGFCTGLHVSATGARGSRAKLSPPQLPACLPVISPG
jgi:hypothetical protein